MSGLKDSIRQSKEERTKKLEALRAAKQAREEAKKKTSSFLDPTMRDDINRSYNSDLSFNISESSKETTIITKTDFGIKTTTKLYLNPKPKVISYDREIQVEIETDSDDEEKENSLKGLRKASFHATNKSEVKEEEVVEDKKIKELDAEEAEKIISTEQFEDFFSRCSVIIEKALVEKFDVVEDFILQQKSEDPFDQKGKIKLVQMLHYGKEDRCVSSLEWSPNYDDTIIASYILSEFSSSKNSQGIINIWHLEDPTKPKHSLYSQSPITQASIYPNDTNLVLGGSYTGQLLI